VLQAFGWRVLTVFAKDWYHDPAKTLQRIEDALAGVQPPEEKVELPPEPAPAQVVPAPPPITVSPVARSAAAAVPAVETSSVAPAPVAVRLPPPSPAPAREPLSQAQAASAQETSIPTGFRRFTCTEDGASKFWEVAAEGTELTVRFGRIGTRGQTKQKTFGSAAEATREKEKLIREKVGKGYVEQGG
jgi:predicted DNA-binding WGR domain protein